MSRSSEVQVAWTLTVLRRGAQGVVGDISDAEFLFARKKDEVEGSPVRSLPTGLMALLLEGGLADEALETGFAIEMCRFPRSEVGWRLFEMLAGHASWGPGHHHPRFAYALEDGGGTVELADVSCCSFYNQLPPRIWVRVTPLTMPIVAWAMGNGIYSCLEGDQRTLNDWVDLSDLLPPKKAEELALPGPPHSGYRFL